MPKIEFVGSAEAADLLEIGPTNFSHLRKKMEIAGDTSFPTPYVELRCGPIWTKTDMVKFKKHYDSRRRRVRSSNGDSAVVEETAKPAKATTTKAPAKKVAAKKASVTPIKRTAKKLSVAGKTA